MLCPRWLVCTIQCWHVHHLKTKQDVYFCLLVCLPRPDSPGLWTIMATFSNSPWLSYNANFEVKEYGKHRHQTSHSHFPPKNTISISKLFSGAQPVCTTDPREHVLLRGWRPIHCQHHCSVREDCFFGFNGFKSNHSGVKVKSFSSSLCLGTCLGQRLKGWLLFYLEFNTWVKKSLFQVPSSECW